MGKYEEFKEKAGNKFYCPEGYIVAGEVANTPLYIREWFMGIERERLRERFLKILERIDEMNLGGFSEIEISEYIDKAKKKVLK